MDGRKYQRKSGIKRTLVMLLALVLMTSAFIPGLTARAAEEPATPPEGEEETLTLEKVLENPPTDYETSTEYLNNLDTLVQKLDVDCTKDDCKALYDAVVKAQALIAELTLTEEQETAFTKLAEDILTCLKEEKGYKPEEEEEITPLSDPEPTPDPVCPGDDTCTIEGCTNHAPKCPGDDTCTIEGCTNHAPKCPGDDTCTIEGCTNHAPKCPGDETCTIEGCTNHAPKCPGDDTCTIEGCTNHAPKCPGDDTCTIEGCTNHVPVCDNCQGEHKTEECTKCTTCKTDPCSCLTECAECGELHEKGTCLVKTSIVTQTLVQSVANGNVTAVKGPTFTKVANLREDGNYDLKLTISGAFAQETSPAKVDIVLIIDRSGSMVENYVSTGETRFANAIAAAKSLVQAVSKNGNISAHFNIVTFEGRINATDGYTRKWNTVSGWQTTKSAALTVIDNIDDAVRGAATNYEAAFEELREALPNSNRKGAAKVVIFLTDGDPTIRSSNEDKTEAERKAAGYVSGTSHYYGSGMASNATNVRKCLEAAKSEISNIVMDRFYAIGTGNVTSSNLTELGNAAKNAGYVQVKTTADSDLTKIFNNIAAEITNFYCNNVTVTDRLKHVNNQLMVDIVDPKKIYVTVYDSGEVKAGPATSVTLDNMGPITAEYNSSTHVLTLDFPDDYNLKETYTYEISAIIAPTEKAYREYRKQFSYTNTGDANTGTHSGEEGFQCNDEAIATYYYLGNKTDVKYAHPVVQLTPGTLTINKSIEGLTAEQIAAITDLKFDVTLTYPDDGNGVADEEVTKEIALNQMIQENGVYTYSFKGLSPGTQFVVTESGGEVAEYTMTTEDAGIAAAGDTCITEGDGKCAENCVLHSKITNSSKSDKTVSGTVGRGKEVTAQFTNTYSIAVTSVTVEKQVTGNMGDPNKEFSFTASLEDAEGKTLSMAGITYALYQKDAEGKYVEVSSDSGTIGEADHQFNLKHDQKIVFTGVKIGAEMTVTESADGYTATYSVDGADTANGSTATFTVKNDGNTVAFNNTKNATIDTGIVTDSIPYILLLTMAVIGAGVLLLNKRRGF